MNICADVVGEVEKFKYLGSVDEWLFQGRYEIQTGVWMSEVERSASGVLFNKKIPISIILYE